MGSRRSRCCATNSSVNSSNEDIGRSCWKPMSLRHPLVDDYVTGGEAEHRRRCSRQASATDSARCRETANSSNGSASTTPAAPGRIGFASTASTLRWSSPAHRARDAHCPAAVEYLPAALRPESVRDARRLARRGHGLDQPGGDVRPGSVHRRLRPCSRSAHRRGRPRQRRCAARHQCLRPADPAGYDRRRRARAHRSGAACAITRPWRAPRPIASRPCSACAPTMMAENLLAVVAQEQRRGPSLVFAHNAHPSASAVRPCRSTDDVSDWASAGALVGLALGERYMFLATDASPAQRSGNPAGRTGRGDRSARPVPGAGPARCASARRSARANRSCRGHIPLSPADVDGADAVIFVADTDGHQHQYW